MHTPPDRERYYQAAAVGLRALEAREGRGRRLGPDADAAWAAFAGTFHPESDRLELLLRDAAVVWGLAFDARAVFGLAEVASDDPFGAAWPHANPALRRGSGSLFDPAGPEYPLQGRSGPGTLADAARALGLALGRVTLPPLGAATRLVLAGPSAFAAAASAFAADRALSWDRQVVAVADAPAHRQFAGLCALFAAADAATRVLWSTDALPAGTAVVSPDAEPEVARAMEGR